MFDENNKDVHSEDANDKNISGNDEKAMNEEKTESSATEEKKTGYVNVGSSGTNSANNFEEAKTSSTGYSGYRYNPGYGTGSQSRPHYTSYSSTSGNQAGSTTGTSGSNGTYTGKTVDGKVREPGGGKTAKKKGGVAGFFKKAVAAIVVGVLVGGSAAGAFYGVYKATGLDDAVATIAGANETVKKIEKAKNSAVAKPTGESGQEDPTYTAVVSGSADVSDVVEKALPSVVAIQNEAVLTGQTWWGEEIQQRGEYAGSGIIVGKNDEELLIVTNQHVIDSAEELSITFVDDTTAEANLKGEDAESDVAVVAVALSDISDETLDAISIAEMGDSKALKVGEQVVAIGNAMGYGITTTTGIVSALDADFSTVEFGMIQTDAAINPGNSGGALLNMKGELIGINEAKASKLLSTGMIVEGMGYAIPISTVSELIDEMMNKETKSKADEGNQGYLGIGGVDVTPDISEKYDMPEGIYVAQVDSGSAADKAGLGVGDVITKFDGQSVSSMGELKKLMEYYEAGTTVKLDIKAITDDGYEDKEVEVTLGKKPSDVS